MDSGLPQHVLCGFAQCRRDDWLTAPELELAIEHYGPCSARTNEVRQIGNTQGHTPCRSEKLSLRMRLGGEELLAYERQHAHAAVTGLPRAAPFSDRDHRAKVRHPREHVLAGDRCSRDVRHVERQLSEAQQRGHVVVVEMGVRQRHRGGLRRQRLEGDGIISCQPAAVDGIEKDPARDAPNEKARVADDVHPRCGIEVGSGAAQPELNAECPTRRRVRHLSLIHDPSSLALLEEPQRTAARGSRKANFRTPPQARVGRRFPDGRSWPRGLAQRRSCATLRMRHRTPQAAMQSAPTDFPLLSDREVVEAITQQLEREGRIEVKLWGRSMLPWVWPGARLEIERCRDEEVELGDLVLLRNGSTLALHRVVQRHPRLVTQGDAFPEPDGSGAVIGFVSSLVAGTRSLQAPLPVVRLFNRGALASAIAYRRLEPTLRVIARAAWRTGLHLPGIPSLRTALLPWRVELLTPAHLPSLRPYLLSRGMRPTQGALTGWRRATEPHGPFAVLALAEDRIIGSVRVGIAKDGATYLTDLFVARSYRALGVATELVAASVREATSRGTKRLHANVRGERGSAWIAFRRNGFAEIGERTPITPDHLLMTWSAPESGR